MRSQRFRHARGQGEATRRRKVTEVGELNPGCAVLPTSSKPNASNVRWFSTSSILASSSSHVRPISRARRSACSTSRRLYPSPRNTDRTAILPRYSTSVRGVATMHATGGEPMTHTSPGGLASSSMVRRCTEDGGSMRSSMYANASRTRSSTSARSSRSPELTCLISSTTQV